MKKIQNLCFDVHERENKQCTNKECRLWIDCNSHNNCTLIAAKTGPMTLQDIGEIFDVTRMRICQLEKKIVLKLNQIIKRTDISIDNIL